MLRRHEETSSVLLSEAGCSAKHCLSSKKGTPVSEGPPEAPIWTVRTSWDPAIGLLVLSPGLWSTCTHGSAPNAPKSVFSCWLFGCTS